MIVIKFLGGMCNTLFQRAYGLALEARGYEVAFDKSALVPNTHREYSLDAFNTQVRFADPVEPIVYESSLLHRESMLLPTDPSTIVGYFQTEKYFSNIADKVRENFQIVLPLSDHALGLKEEILGSNSVFMHIRRQDYVGLQHFHGMPSKAYYERALDRIQMASGRLNIFLFTDDPEYCKANFDYGVVEHTTKYEDLFLMSCCKHSVIANSSFSWWGAWLNPDRERIVISPKQWFNPAANMDDSDICPPRWERL